MSSATALEDFQNAPAGESTFRVFERPAEAHKSFDGGMKLAKAMGRPNSQPLFNEDNIFEESRENRYANNTFHYEEILQRFLLPH